jgi:hypothetical protein
VHGLFAPAFANRQTFPKNEISALTLAIVRRTIDAALPQHFAETADVLERQPLANQPKFKHFQLLTGAGLSLPIRLCCTDAAAKAAT